MNDRRMVMVHESDVRWYICDCTQTASICVESLEAAHAVRAMIDPHKFRVDTIVRVWKQYYSEHVDRYGPLHWWAWREVLAWADWTLSEKNLTPRFVSAETATLYNARFDDKYRVDCKHHVL